MIRVKSVILPYEALSNFDLINASKDLKIECFRGVYLLDTMPGKPNNRECGITNLDKNGGPGTHWELGLKMEIIKFISIVTASNHRKKLLNIWGRELIIIPIKYNQEGRYSVGICVYMY